MYLYLDLMMVAYAVTSRYLIKRTTSDIRRGAIYTVCNTILQTNPVILLLGILGISSHFLGVARFVQMVYGVFLVLCAVMLVFAQVIVKHEEIIHDLINQSVSNFVGNTSKKIVSSFMSVESNYEKAIDMVSCCTAVINVRIKSLKQYVSELSQFQKLKYFIIFCVAMLTQIMFGFIVIWYKNGMPYRHYKILNACYCGWLISIFEATDMKISKIKEPDADQIAIITTQQSLFGDASKMTKKQKNSVVVVVLAILAYLVNNDISKFDAFFTKWNAMKQAVDSSNTLYNWLFSRDDKESDPAEEICANTGIERTCLGNKWGNGLCANCTEEAIKRAFLHKVKIEDITSEIITRDPKLFASRLVEQMYQDQVNGEKNTVNLIPAWFKKADKKTQKLVTDVLRVHLDTFLAGQFHVYSNGTDYAVGGMAVAKFRSHKRPDATTSNILKAKKSGKTTEEIQDKYFESTHSESNSKAPTPKSTPRTAKQFNFDAAPQETDEQEADDEKSSEEDKVRMTPPPIITNEQSLSGDDYIRGMRYNVAYKNQVMQKEREIMEIIKEVNRNTTNADIAEKIQDGTVVLDDQTIMVYEKFVHIKRHMTVYFYCLHHKKVQENMVIFENTMKGIWELVDTWLALYGKYCEDYESALQFYEMRMTITVVKQPLWLTCVDLTDKFFVNLQKVVMLPTKIPYIGVYFDATKSGFMTSWLAYTILFSLMQALVKMLMREKDKESQSDVFFEDVSKETPITTEESKGGMSRHRSQAKYKQRHEPSDHKQVRDQEYDMSDFHLPVESTHLTAFISYDPVKIMEVIQKNPNTVKAFLINNASVSGSKQQVTSIEDYQKLIKKMPEYIRDDAVLVPNIKHYRKGEWKTILDLYPEAFKWYVDRMDYELMKPMQKLSHHEDLEKFEMDKIKSAWKNKTIVISDPQSAQLFQHELNSYVYDPKTSMNKYKQSGGRTYELKTIEEESRLIDQKKILKRVAVDDINVESTLKTYQSSRPQDYENVKRSLGLLMYTKDLKDRTVGFPKCREQLQDIEKQLELLSKNIDIHELQELNKNSVGITNPESVNPSKPFQHHAPDIRAIFCIGYEDTDGKLKLASGCIWTGQSIYTTKHTFIKEDRNLLKDHKFWLVHPFTRCKTPIVGIDVIKTGKYKDVDICRPIISGFPALVEKIQEKMNDDDFMSHFNVAKLSVINASDHVLNMPVIKYSIDGNWNMKVSFGRILSVMNGGIVKADYQSEIGDSGSAIYTEHGSIIGIHLGDIEKQRGFQSFDTDLVAILRTNGSLEWGQDFC